MAIKVGGTEVIDNSLGLKNIASVDATTITTLQDAKINVNVEAVALSGTTPSLNYDNGNVFTHTPTAATTFTFTGTDTAANFNLIITEKEGYDFSSLAYQQSFDTDLPAPHDVFFKPDGTKMYVAGWVLNIDIPFGAVIEYSLSTAWNVATASYVQNFSVASQENNPKGLFFKSDGTKMYVVGSFIDAVSEYSLSTAWDVSTASYVQNFSVTTEETSPTGIFFKPDGTKMYIVGDNGIEVNEYSLSGAWDISTASYVQNFSVSSQESLPTGVFFKSDGTKMYIIGTDGDDVNEYSLSSAWDISTASYAQNFSVATESPAPSGLYINPPGNKMFIIGITNSTVYEYDMGGTPYSLIFPDSVQLLPVNRLAGTKTSFEFVTTDSGSTYQCINATGGAESNINFLDVTALGISEAKKAVTTDANGVTTFDGGVVEDDTTITSGLTFPSAATINCHDGNVFSHTLTEDVTYTFSNAPASGRAFSFTLKVTQDSTARTITWPASVDWPSATAPTLSTGSGEVDVFVFFTVDGGTTWYGFTAGQVMS